MGLLIVWKVTGKIDFSLMCMFGGNLYSLSAGGGIWTLVRIDTVGEGRSLHLATWPHGALPKYQDVPGHTQRRDTYDPQSLVLLPQKEVFMLEEARTSPWFAYARPPAAQSITSGVFMPPVSARGQAGPIIFATGTARDCWLVREISGLDEYYDFHEKWPRHDYGYCIWIIPQFVPIVLLAALIGVAVLVGFIGHLRRARRIRRELCPTCGYDLRATTDRCPECGTVKDKRVAKVRIDMV